MESAFPVGRAAVETLRAAAEERPVVLALDDAQWLDRETAHELGAILRDLSAASLTVLLALVPHPKRPELDELRSRIGRDLAGEAVRLRPLDRAALRRLAERMLPGYERVAVDRVTRRVATDSAGMPLLAVELLRAVALGLDLGTISETWPEPMRTLPGACLPASKAMLLRSQGRAEASLPILAGLYCLGSAAASGDGAGPGKA